MSLKFVGNAGLIEVSSLDTRMNSVFLRNVGRNQMPVGNPGLMQIHAVNTGINVYLEDWNESDSYIRFEILMVTCCVLCNICTTLTDFKKITTSSVITVSYFVPSKCCLTCHLVVVHSDYMHCICRHW